MRSTFSSRGVSFGAGKRANANNYAAFVPGPGAYQPVENKTQGIGFGKGRRDKLVGDQRIPGPGQYTVNQSLFRDSKYASLKGRPKTSKPDAKPGPGHYQSKSMFSSPSYSMGVKTKLKELTSKNNPGPGGYNPDFKAVKESVPSCAFGSPNKSLRGDSSMPGPGQYELKQIVGNEGPKYAIKGKYNQNKKDLIPGPGNYNPKDEIVRHGTPGTVMGSGKRQGLGFSGDRAPGPGTYDQNKSLDRGKHFSFGSGSRDRGLGSMSRGIPGPGTYASQSFIGKDTQGRSILGKAKTKIGTDVPGPGTYAPKANRNGPSYSLSGQRTVDPVMRERARMPPPGNYNPNDSLIKLGSPNVVFGKRPKSASVLGDGMPGPGQYELKSTLAGKGAHIGVKYQNKISEKSPGPAAYNPKGDTKYGSGPAFTISGVKGDQYMPTRGFPGPGTYDSPHRPSTGVRFGSERRDGLGSKGDSPGPGQYQLKGTIGNEGKSIIIAGRHEDKKDVNLVGPGQYQLPSTLTGPKFSMGTGEKGTKLNKDALLNPPPGSYSLDSHAEKHGISFGKDTRDKSKGDGLPGPGAYAVPSTLDNKGISIQGKTEMKIPNLSPGPGAYNSKEDLLKGTGGTVSFGKEPKNSGPKVTYFCQN